MLRHIGIGLCLLFCSADSVNQDKITWDDSNYELVFYDDFSGQSGSLPDPAKWSCSPRGSSIWSRWISNSPRVAYVKKGTLVCRAVPNRTERADTAAMLTGAIETKDKFYFQYGKLEVRMKTNLKRGNFPAVWLVPQYDKTSDNRYGEIDVVEMFGNEGKAAHTVHTHRSFTLKKEGVKRIFSSTIDVTKWHVYGIVWEKDRIIWTLDGEAVAEYPRLNTRQMQDEGQWTFDRPFYIRLNQSVGDGSHPLLVPNLKSTYETRFDWVKVYQKKRN